MNKLSEAIKRINELDGKCKNQKIRGKKTKWTELFESEEGLVEALNNIVPDSQFQYECNPYIPIYMGFEYINSFAKRVQSGKDLTEGQMRQAKRLAVEIKKAEILGIALKGGSQK